MSVRGGEYEESCVQIAYNSTIESVTKTTLVGDSFEARSASFFLARSRGVIQIFRRFGGDGDNGADAIGGGDAIGQTSCLINS